MYAQICCTCKRSRDSYCMGLGRGRVRWRLCAPRARAPRLFTLPAPPTTAHAVGGTFVYLPSGLATNSYQVPEKTWEALHPSQQESHAVGSSWGNPAQTSRPVGGAPALARRAGPTGRVHVIRPPSPRPPQTGMATSRVSAVARGVFGTGMRDKGQRDSPKL